MVDDHRRYYDEDVDPDAISIWDLPLAPRTVERASLPATEIAAAASAADEDDSGEVSTSYGQALAATEEWFEANEPPDDATTRFRVATPPPPAGPPVPPEPPNEPPPPVSEPPAPAPLRPSGSGLLGTSAESEWTRFSRALGGTPAPREPETDEEARAPAAEPEAVASPPPVPPEPFTRRVSFEAEGALPLEEPPAPAPAVSPAAEWEQFEAALGVRVPPPTAPAAPPPTAPAAPPPPTAAAPVRPAGRRTSGGLILFGVLFALALVVLGALLTTAVGGPAGGDRGLTLLVWLASVAVAGALVGGAVVAVVLLRRPGISRRSTSARPTRPAQPPRTIQPAAPRPSPSPPPQHPGAVRRPGAAPRPESEPTPAAWSPPSPDEDEVVRPGMPSRERRSEPTPGLLSPPPPELAGSASRLPSEIAAEPSPYERFVPPRSTDPAAGTDWAEGDTIIERYRIARKILSGMGVVYLCHDAVQRAPVAIKTYRDLDGQARTPDGRQRDVLLARLFEAEALIWTRLGSHPNIVEAQYVVELHGKPHLFLELVSGPDGRERTLRQLVKAGPQEPARAIRLGLQVCAGLEHATRVFPGLVHRDLKPENLLLADGDIVKVTDFGLTRVFADVSGRVAALAGTPAYMSPEQCLGLSSLDTRADIYSLGVILYELLTGRRPFTRDFLQAHLTETPADPRQQIPELPESLAAIVLRCLAKRPEQRFETFTELRAALAACYLDLTGQPAAMPAANPQPRSEREQAGIDLARAISLATLGRYDEAVGLLNRAVLFDPGYAEAWRWRGIGLTALGQLAEAADCFDRAVALAPGDIDAWLEKGRLASRLGRREEAMQSFDAALRVDPEHIGARYERGAALFFLGRYAEARADLAWANLKQPGPALQAAVDAASHRIGTPEPAGDNSALDGLPALISEAPVSQSIPEHHP